MAAVLKTGFPLKNEAAWPGNETPPEHVRQKMGLRTEKPLARAVRHGDCLINHTEIIDLV
jgi:hypothetical protein